MDKQQVLQRFNTCVGAGDVAGAHAVIEQAYPGLSRDLDIAFLFARVRMEQGRFKDAARILKPLTVALPNETVIRMAYLNALNGDGDYKTAVAFGKRILGKPHAPEEAMAVAQAYGLWGKLAPAISILEKITARHPGHADAWAMLGVLRNQTGDIAGGIACLGRAVALSPDHPQYLFDLASLHIATEENDAAADLLQRLVEKVPNHFQGLKSLSEILVKTGRNAEATPYLTRALSLKRDDLSLWSAYLTAEAMHGDAARAEALANDLLQAHPGDPRILRDLAFIKCRAGDVDAVRTLCADLAEIPATAITALALESTALNKAGRRDDAARILGIDTLVTSGVIETPEGWDDLDAFNAALTEQILNHPDLGRHETNRSLINESCTFELFDGKETGAIKALKSVLDAAAHRYADEVAKPGAAPEAYLACKPETFRIECWANVMRHAGNHAAHYHPRAWLSGVYYPCLPESMDANDDDTAGALEVGCGFADFLPAPDEPVRAVKPREGTLTLFPSYIGHRTVPVETDGKPRISIAFNVAISNQSGARPT